jgi:hypothetical protein
MLTMHALPAVWQLRIVVFVLLACGCGHLDRKIERWRFARHRRRLGYRSHGDYVGGPEWRARRRRYLTEHPPSGCRVCGRRWQARWPLHHKDYSRAGDGAELDRDLIPVCEPCHTLIHQMWRPHGVLRRAGVTLRASTWLTVGRRTPGRWIRRSFHPDSRRYDQGTVRGRHHA